MAEMPIGICIVPWNSDKWTTHFVQQVRKHTKHPYRLFISDNSDEPHPVTGGDIEYWWNAANLGFAKAINRALYCVRSDEIIVCNTDLDLQDNWLGKLVQCYRETDFAIIAPTMNSRWQKPEMFRKYDSAVVETKEAPIGALWIISKSRLLDKTGYWDEQFSGVGCADLYHCWRAWKAGGHVGICRTVYIHHYPHGTTEANITHEEHCAMVARVKKRLVEIYGPKFGGTKPL